MLKVVIKIYLISSQLKNKVIEFMILLKLIILIIFFLLLVITH
jgi:hypothetical protein